MRRKSGRPEKSSPSTQTVPASRAWRSVSEMRGIKPLRRAVRISQEGMLPEYRIRGGEPAAPVRRPYQRYSRPAKTEAPSPGRNWAESRPRASGITPVVAA